MYEIRSNVSVQTIDDEITVYLISENDRLNHSMTKGLQQSGFKCQVQPFDLVWLENFAQTNTGYAVFFIDVSFLTQAHVSDYVDALVFLHQYAVIAILDPKNAPLFFTVAEFSEHTLLDCVYLPLRSQELVWRVSLMIRRYNSDICERQTIVLGPYRFERYPNQVYLGKQLIHLTSKEFDVAYMLFKNFEHIVSRLTLEKSIWQLADDELSRTVDTHIARVRRKLKLDGRSGYILNSVYSFGYLIGLKKKTN